MIKIGIFLIEKHHSSGWKITRVWWGSAMRVTDLVALIVTAKTSFLQITVLQSQLNDIFVGFKWTYLNLSPKMAEGNQWELTMTSFCQSSLWYLNNSRAM